MIKPSAIINWVSIGAWVMLIMDATNIIAKTRPRVKPQVSSSRP